MGMESENWVGQGLDSMSPAARRALEALPPAPPPLHCGSEAGLFLAFSP